MLEKKTVLWALENSQRPLGFSGNLILYDLYAHGLETHNSYEMHNYEPQHKLPAEGRSPWTMKHDGLQTFPETVLRLA